MGTQIDIQMPLIKGGSIIGDVIQRLLMQDVDFNFYIDASADFAFSEDHDRLLELITAPTEDKGRSVGGTKKRIRIASKRNRLRLKGDSPYVYLADADLLLPGKPFFGHMIRALAENARIGAIGLCCFPDRDHVSFASMMLRRRDFVEIGEIRDVAISCGCGYVVRKLEQAGLRVVPVKAETLKPKHLKTECDSKYSEYEEVRYQASPDGILDRTLLENTIRRYGTQFKLFIDG